MDCSAVLDRQPHDHTERRMVLTVQVEDEVVGLRSLQSPCDCDCDCLPPRTWFKAGQRGREHREGPWSAAVRFAFPRLVGGRAEKVSARHDRVEGLERGWAG
jgi:hypothetical protein